MSIANSPQTWSGYKRGNTTKGSAEMLPPRPPNAVFRFRINGEIMSIATNKFIEAEWIARREASPLRVVEIFDGVTGAVLKRLPEETG